MMALRSIMASQVERFSVAYDEAALLSIKATRLALCRSRFPSRTAKTIGCCKS